MEEQVEIDVSLWIRFAQIINGQAISSPRMGINLPGFSTYWFDIDSDRYELLFYHLAKAMWEHGFPAWQMAYLPTNDSENSYSFSWYFDYPIGKEPDWGDEKDSMVASGIGNNFLEAAIRAADSAISAKETGKIDGLKEIDIDTSLVQKTLIRNQFLHASNARLRRENIQLRAKIEQKTR